MGVEVVMVVAAVLTLKTNKKTYLLCPSIVLIILQFYQQEH